MKETAKRAINSVLANAGVRLVSKAWGPRGFAESFARIRRLGVIPEQIVDVGASNGQWTRECMAVFPESKYLLVDPLPENVGPLESLARERGNVRYWQGGLAGREGTLELIVHGDQSSFLASEYSGKAERRGVPVRTLDSFRGTELMPAGPSLIKVDVQGYELEVMRGATGCMETAEFVMLEVSYRRVYAGCPLAHEVVAFMGGHGYRVYDICTYAQRPRDGELVQSDMLFAKDGSRVFEFEGYA
jgi:FkbM family methyltransferase